MTELEDLRKRGIIHETEYLESRRAALGLGLEAQPALYGTTVVAQVVPTPTVSCRCGETMIYVPAELAVMQVSRRGRRLRPAVCGSCHFATTAKFVCPAPSCGISLCDTCGRSCGVPYGLHHQWINQPRQFQTTLVGDWCQYGQT